MMGPSFHPPASAAMTTEANPPARRHQPWYKILYIQVLIAIALGILIGNFWPHLGKELKPLGDGFIALIKMMIAPIIFCTVVHGISSMGDLKRVGRVGLKALIYFETVSTVALAIGLLVGEVLQPGRGFNIDPASIDAKSVETYVHQAKEQGIVAHLLGIIPDSFIGALARGDLLQVLLVSILSGFAIAFMGKAGEPIAHAVDQAAKMFFGIIRIIVRVAPLGAFGAMAFTVGAYGLSALWNLIALIGTFYLTSILFVLIVLGSIARLSGFSILRFIAYIKDELLIVLGTSSPATLSIVPNIPILSIAILVGIDKFMSECRALTNLIGNGVACVVISLSEGELDKEALHETMAHLLEIGEALEPGAT